jgi:hypothetical protein
MKVFSHFTQDWPRKWFFVIVLYADGRAAYEPVWLNSCPKRLRHRDADPVAYYHDAVALGGLHEKANHPGRCACVDNLILSRSYPVPSNVFRP